MWRRPEPPLDNETVNSIIRKLMEMDTKLDRLLELQGEDDAEEDGS
jgi:hypothetical protein